MLGTGRKTHETNFKVYRQSHVFSSKADVTSALTRCDDGPFAQADCSGGMISNTGIQALARHVHASSSNVETASGNV